MDVTQNLVFIAVLAQQCWIRINLLYLDGFTTVNSCQRF